MFMSQFIYNRRKNSLKVVSDLPYVHCKVSLAIESNNQPGLKISVSPGSNISGEYIWKLQNQIEIIF